VTRESRNEIKNDSGKLVSSFKKGGGEELDKCPRAGFSLSDWNECKKKGLFKMTSTNV